MLVFFLFGGDGNGVGDDGEILNCSMSKLISQVLLIFLNQEWIGVSKCVPVSRPLGYLWFGGSFFPLGHTKEGDYIFFFLLPSRPCFLFHVFPYFSPCGVIANLALQNCPAAAEQWCSALCHWGPFLQGMQRDAVAF